MEPVALPPRSAIVKKITETSLYRYWAISILYIIAFGIAVFAFGACVFAGLNNVKLKYILELFGSGSGSGVLGGFLLKVDGSEKENIRYHQALDILLGMPQTDETQQTILNIISERLGIKGAYSAKGHTAAKAAKK